MIDIKELTKMYYSIGEVAKLFSVNTSLLRYWEKEFQIKIDKKTINGKRNYSVNEIMKIAEIFVLLKEKNYTIEGAKKVLNGSKNDNNKNIAKEEVLKKLEEIKSKLKKLITNNSTNL